MEPQEIISFFTFWINLDDTSILHGLEMLNSIAREYQMIYFVCHGSRQ